MDSINILITGIGGQGIILASDILAETAMSAGYDVKKTDSIGMAQRGGSVISHVRLGPVVYSPLIPARQVDILMGMEKLETARSSHLLKQGGVVLASDYIVWPPQTGNGTSRAYNEKNLAECLCQQTDRLFLVDAMGKARQLGNIRIVNIFILGCLSRFLPIEENLWLDCLAGRLPERILDINLKAFELGTREIQV